MVPTGTGVRGNTGRATCELGRKRRKETGRRRRFWPRERKGKEREKAGLGRKERRERKKVFHFTN